MGGGKERGEESDHTHRYSTPAFQNKYAGRGGGGKWVLLSIIYLVIAGFAHNEFRSYRFTQNENGFAQNNKGFAHK